MKGLVHGVGERAMLAIGMLCWWIAEGLQAISKARPRQASLLVVGLSLFSRGCPLPGVKILVYTPVMAENPLLRC